VSASLFIFGEMAKNMLFLQLNITTPHLKIIYMAHNQIVTHKLTLPDATSLAASIRNGEFSAEKIVKEHLDRLQSHHSSLNAATHIFREQALEQAKNPIAGPLSGIPISIKESFGIAGETITVGAKNAVHYEAKEDCFVVKKMREAGAIIIARSNLPDFGMLPETSNLIWGQTNNPLNLEHTVGGSSGGEGALVASGSTVLGLGSDIGGSVRYPAAFCGIVGFKPSSEAVDKTGTYPVIKTFSDSMLAIGPITRSVRDAKLVYNLIAKKPISEETKELSALRLFYPETYRKKLKDSEISAAVGSAQALLSGTGMSKAQGEFDDANSLYKDFSDMIVYEFESAMHESLCGGVAGKRISLLQEAMNQAIGKPTIHNWLFQMLMAMPILRPSNKKYGQILERVAAAREKYYQMLGDDGIMVLPSVGCLAPLHGKFVAELRQLGVVETMKPTVFCNILNLPAITLPAWNFRKASTGLVPAVTLACKPGAEAALFAAAEWLENRI
jgi:aspartyl-tRNA(Asn)/glutamyl-tRNA(Gln) amidotransferase subunit A/fatty acid amide hydrolase 2